MGEAHYPFDPMLNEIVLKRKELGDYDIEAGQIIKLGLIQRLEYLIRHLL